MSTEQDKQAVWDAIAYAPEDIRDAARLAHARLHAEEYAAIARGERGFVIKGWDSKTLVSNLSRVGELTNVLNEAAAMYGFTLVIDEDVATRLNAKDAPSYQQQVGEWMHECFEKALYGDMRERGDRFLEECLELLQAHGYDRTRVPTLVDYVYNRPVGDPRQEVGGVMITLAGYCYIAGIDMDHEAQAELNRIRQPEVMQKIRSKQAAKRDIHGPKP